MSALERAIETYNARVMVLSSPLPETANGSRFTTTDASRGLVAGTDLLHDEVFALARTIARAIVSEVLAADIPLPEAVAGAWRAGLIIGRLYEPDDLVADGGGSAE